MRPRRAIRPILAALAIALAAVAAVPVALGSLTDVPGGSVAIPSQGLPPASNPGGAPANPPINPPGSGDGGQEGAEPGFAQNVRDSFQDQMVVAGLATLALTGAGLVGFALVSRYITPEEALKNPQRSMLYGYVRGNPGVHLKRLSDEFHMKTSSILWHIRKLECAELVRSERSNGFRVFYPTAGGVEVRNISRAVTALQNPNAAALFEALAQAPAVAATPLHLAGFLRMPVGTARWHLKKLREFGLVEEVAGPEGARFLPTPLGRKAFQSLSSPGSPGAAADAAIVTA